MMSRYDPNKPLETNDETPPYLEHNTMFDIKVIHKSGIGKERIETLLTEIAKIEKFRKEVHRGREIMCFSVRFRNTHIASDDILCVIYRDEVKQVLRDDIVYDVDVIPSNIC
jgi:hypothetical protein